MTDLDIACGSDMSNQCLGAFNMYSFQGPAGCEFSGGRRRIFVLTSMRKAPCCFLDLLNGLLV